MAQITHHCGNPPISVKIRGKTTGRQHDLKDRMPERSEWLLAGGGAKRNPRYCSTHHDAFEEREYRLPWRHHSRPPDACRWVGRHPGGCANAPPPATSTRASPSAFNLSGWIPQPPRHKKTQIYTPTAHNTFCCHYSVQITLCFTVICNNGNF